MGSKKGVQEPEKMIKIYVNHVVCAVQRYLTGSPVFDGTGFDGLNPQERNVTPIMEEGPVETHKGDMPVKLRK